jgi:N-acetylglutamate synthase-like GNAT family acetyltransferase
MIRHGILRFPILFGWKTFYRLLLSNDSYETITEKYVLSRRNNLELDDPSLYSYSYRVLERMAVHPSMHRKGIGSYFLRKALFSDHQSHDDTNNDGSITSIGGDCSKAVRNNDNSWCILQTDKEQNVAFFSKLGFTVAEKNVFEPHRFSSSVTTWLMVLSPIVAPTEAQ